MSKEIVALGNNGFIQIKGTRFIWYRIGIIESNKKTYPLYEEFNLNDIEEIELNQKRIPVEAILYFKSSDKHKEYSGRQLKITVKKGQLASFIKIRDLINNH